jgi:hypothetical protein
MQVRNRNGANALHATMFGMMMGAEAYLRDMENGMVFSAPIDAIFTTAFYIAASHTLSNISDNSIFLAGSLGVSRAALNCLSFSTSTMFGRGVVAAATSTASSFVTDVLMTPRPGK